MHNHPPAATRYSNRQNLDLHQKTDAYRYRMRLKTLTPKRIDKTLHRVNKQQYLPTYNSTTFSNQKVDYLFMTINT